VVTLVVSTGPNLCRHPRNLTLWRHKLKPFHRWRYRRCYDNRWPWAWWFSRPLHKALQPNSSLQTTNKS